MNSNNTVQAVKDAVDIVDLISQYTTLVQAGKKMKGLSPFTNEKTPSFFVDQTEGVYYCFSSQKGGDIFSFIQEMEGVDFKEALRILAERAGIDLQSGGRQEEKNTMLYKILQEAAEAYQTHLNKEKDVQDYLKVRGMTKETVKIWGIGYAPDAWNTLCNKQTPNLSDCVKAGMCVKTEKGVYDRFRKRIQFPFHDNRDRVIGFSGRAYNDEKSAKYINSPESPLFNKSAFIYGLNRAKALIRKHDAVMLTEGPIDAILAHQAGYPIAVATSGTAVTETHLKTIRQLSSNLLVAFDSDEAGERASLKAIEMAAGLGMHVKVVVLPEGSDPADLIKKDPEAFRKAVKEALPMMRFVLRRVEKKQGHGEDSIREVKKEVLPVIASIQDSMMKENAINEVASFCKISADAIKEDLARMEKNAPKEEPELTRKKSISPEQQEKKKKRLKEYLQIIAMAKTFLKDDIEEKSKEKIQEIEKVIPIPTADEKAAKLRYEEVFPNKKTQKQGVQTELKDLLKRAELELKKEAEREKARKAST